MYSILKHLWFNIHQKNKLHKFYFVLYACAHHRCISCPSRDAMKRVDVNPFQISFLGNGYVDKIRPWGLQPTTCNFQVAPEQKSEPNQKKLSVHPDFENEVAFAFLKTTLCTKPILNAPHLQGPKSNIHVYFHLVNEQLSGVSFLYW